MIDELLNEYKSITISIIEKIGNDEEALKLIEKREKLIKKIFTEENNIEEIKKAYLDMNLLDLDEKLKNAIDNEKFLVKEEIRNIHKMKNANNAYGKNRKVNNYFNTKI
ncbi:flagellar protein FliT [Clostridium sp.]|uniref:flagellar protein FliT n=1 Tax=Clostridium sp. TaxID=1506 RepID=UPI00290969B8|nr:flagellar protein FliT [Clostridium sp.]MDU5105250.1 flagellar protein FliT [Clostridium sp.]